jgi:hypothetical protein
MALLRAATPEFLHHSAANCSAEIPSTERIPRPKRTWMDASFKQFNMKAKLLLKIKTIRKHVGLSIQLNYPQAFPIL